MSISIAARKAKGRRLQQWVCEKISLITGLPWGKDLDIDSRPMGQSGVDVILRGAALQKAPFSIECKNQEKWSVIKWVEQAKANEKSNTDWLLVVSKNNVKPVVIMDAETFFERYIWPFIVRMEENL